MSMYAEYRVHGRRMSPGFVCCGTFYLRQKDAMRHLRKVHRVDQSQAVHQVYALAAAARHQRRTPGGPPCPTS